MKKKLFVTMPIPQATLSKLKTEFDVEINSEDKVLPTDVLLKKLDGKDAVLSLLTDKLNKDVLAKLSPSIKIISTCAVGFDNIDIPTATEKGIVVTNTPGVLTDTTADFAFSLMLATARRIPEGDRFARAGKYTHWGLMLMLGQDIHHKKLGIVGMGRIGKAMALRAKGFDMEIMYTDAYRDEAFEKEHNVKHTDLDTILKECDFITLHVPYMKETHHLIGEKQFNMMKKTAILINTARGPVIEEKAMVKALQTHRIAGVGIDVFEQEPVIPDELKKLDNLVMTPHIASASVETRTKMAELAADNLIAFFKTGKPNTPVNPDVLNKK